MTTKFDAYKKGDMNIPSMQETWPLYGTGLDNLGKNGKPVPAPVPAFSESELLMRIDAVSLCYTDVKEIDQGQSHPRLTDRDLKIDPIIPGHEISMTVVGVGEKIRDKYHVGARFTLQPDVWVNGKSIPFCFGMDGGYRQYAKIGMEILEGDAGNYLIPIPDEMTYAAAAITEPWACVEAAYRGQYRNTLKKDGETLVMGCAMSRKGYDIEKIISGESIPASVFVCDVPEDFLSKLRTICLASGIEINQIKQSDLDKEKKQFDDIILLDLPIENVNQLMPRMKAGAILSLLVGSKQYKTIEIDLGRLHYDNIYFNGSTSLNVDHAYQNTAPRATLKPNGVTWIIGAGGPMGRMHLQRAIEDPTGPLKIIASEVTDTRFDALNDFVALAKKHKKDLILINPNKDQEKYRILMDEITRNGGVDDIEVMITFSQIIAEAAKYLAVGGVMNIFAGLKRGETTQIDAWLIAGPQQIRLIGHSGSGLDDQNEVVVRVMEKRLRPELSVAAIGGFQQIPEGIHAMKDNVYPGKIVIFPHVKNFPLTALRDLINIVPKVYEALEDGAVWTQDSERKFLEYGLSQ